MGEAPRFLLSFLFLNYQLKVNIPKRQLQQDKALVPCSTHWTRTKPRTREGPHQNCGYHGIRSSILELPSPSYHWMHILLLTRGIGTQSHMPSSPQPVGRCRTPSLADLGNMVAESLPFVLQCRLGRPETAGSRQRSPTG